MNSLPIKLPRRALSSLTLLLMTSTLSACSDDKDAKPGDPQQMMGVQCDAAFAPTVPTALVDDLEDGNAQVAAVAGRNGSWWVTTDGTAGTIEPPGGAAPTTARILGGRCGSTQAVRVTGQGFTDWGAVLSVGMIYTSQEEPFDASAYKGIKFWARVGETNNGSVRVQFQDGDTVPVGGICDPTPNTPDTCYNGFGTTIAPLDTQWRLYQLPFADMTQRDFGHRAPALDPATLYTIEWHLDPNTVFDLWVDDVWFYSE